MENIITKVIALILFANISYAETISCAGITNSPNTTEMKFVVLIRSKIDKFSRQSYYTSSVTYQSPDGSKLIQGIDLNAKVRTLLTKVVYVGSNQENSLELTFNADNVLSNAVLNNPLSCFKNVQVACDIVGNLPVRPICSEDIDKTSVLISAIKISDNIDPVQTAIDCGANVNKVDKNGCTPLMFAVDSTCGTDNAIRYSSSFGITDQIIDLLTSNGAFVNVADKRGETPLIKAVKANLPDVYNTFIASEADFDTQDDLGNTALMYAVLGGDSSIVQQIIEGNPDRRIKNHDGKTAFDIANQWQKSELIDLVRIPDISIVIQGNEDGTCSPLQINLKQGQVVDLTLKATTKMFTLDSKRLGISIMADTNSSKHLTFKADTKGAFTFNCGFHGANQFSEGSFIVQ
ncbi:MAG: cupredoxin domain-containing protein [Bdellovibrio sp.]|nr:cupredoxin domain-containing protein [Bdellovibrio sp.]